MTTERLILRRTAEGDVQDLLECVSHSSFADATPEIVATDEGLRRYIKMQRNYQPFERDPCFDLALGRRADGKPIGLLSLARKEHEQGAIGYALGIDYRGHGHATEAARGLLGYGFGRLDLHRIYADTHSDNPGSSKVMERLGMKREGCFREAVFRDGKWVNVVTYGILAAEWHVRESSAD